MLLPRVGTQNALIVLKYLRLGLFLWVYVVKVMSMWKELKLVQTVIPGTDRHTVHLPMFHLT